MIKQLTPVMVVDRVEPCLEFWTRRLGFTKGHEVKGPDGALIFASAQLDGIEVMYLRPAPASSRIIPATPGSSMATPSCCSSRWTASTRRNRRWPGRRW